jgi:hypothetical protein
MLLLEHLPPSSRCSIAICLTSNMAIHPGTTSSLEPSRMTFSLSLPLMKALYWPTVEKLRHTKSVHNVKALDDSWVNGQPCTVIEMLAHEKLVDEFVGGTVYQAFLSTLSYYR